MTFGRPEPQSSMGPRLVVVSDIGSKDALEVSSAENEGPVQTLGSDGSHPPGRLSRDPQAVGPMASTPRVLILSRGANLASDQIANLTKETVLPLLREIRTLTPERTSSVSDAPGLTDT